jgi:peptidoglycan/LPS O-acetylase OafA/YrhL
MHGEYDGGPMSLPRAIALAALLALCMRLSPVTGWRWLDHPVARFVGTLSYSLYLWHIWSEVMANSMGQPDRVRDVIALLLTLAMALASYRLVERPALRLRDRWVPAARS